MKLRRLKQKRFKYPKKKMLKSLRWMKMKNREKKKIDSKGKRRHRLKSLKMKIKLKNLLPMIRISNQRYLKLIQHRD